MLRAALRLRLLPLSLAALLLAPSPARSTGVEATFSAPLQPPSTGGIEVIDRALAKLSTHKRLLVIGAHPDDEDTTLLALVARGMGGEAGYLSLSRGDGGQNLIGPELGVGLGLIRSRELLAARGMDGARQFFTRAFDFGYTRSLEETLRFWPEPVLLEDAVRVVRRFKPQVIVAVFPPDERAGHGQHQASGLVAGEAYEKAGQAGAFPELAAGLPPWRPQAFYRASWWDPSAATVTYSVAPLDPIDGRSVYQLAMASRSQHRSQDMGMLEPLGPKEGRLAWVDGGAGKEGDGIFAGVDTHLAAIAAPLADDGPEGEAKRTIAARLSEVEALARRAREELTPAAPAAVLPAAVAIVGKLDAARGALAVLPGGGESDAARAVADLLEEKRDVAAHLLAAAAGIAVDAVADRELVTPGEEFTVETTLWQADGRAASDGSAAAAGEGAPADRPAVRLTRVELVSPAGLSPAVASAPVPERTGFEARFIGKPDPEGGYHLDDFRVAFPPGTPPTVPYFLKKPLEGDIYDWSDAPPAMRGEPFGPPPLVARFYLAVPVGAGTDAGLTTEVVLEREVVHRIRDQAVGEVRRPLRVVPALEVASAPDLLVWPVAESAPRELEVTLTSHSGHPLAGAIETTVPAGWPAVALVPFHLDERGDRDTVKIPVRPPSSFAAGSFQIGVAAVPDSASGGGRYALAVPVIDYPHIRPTPMPEPAVSQVSAFELALPPLSRVGYVRGASDRVPEFLREVGVPIELLGPAELAGADLAAFEAIVVGSRAYETDPALGEANKRLLDYARGGGLVIVQYQQYPFIDGGFAPFPMEIARPHDRVTDETAPVTPLDPADPVFTTPNRIGAADWEGWVQERGLYFAHTWDPAYRPLLSLADPGGPELQGGLLVAKLGQGTYVYTGLAFFRQLPAGVPGAYRLFANLLALGEPRQPR